MKDPPDVPEDLQPGGTEGGEDYGCQQALCSTIEHLLYSYHQALDMGTVAFHQWMCTMSHGG